MAAKDAVAAARNAAHNAEVQVGHATRSLEVALYNFLQWYTSWFYWGTGVALGLTVGYFYGLKTYIATVIYDLFHFTERRPPAGLKAAARAPEPASVPAAASQAGAAAQAAAARAVETAQAAQAKIVGAPGPRAPPSRPAVPSSTPAGAA